MHKSSTPLIVTILVAAVLISGGMVFLGLQMRSGGGDSQANIEKGIEAYIQKQQAAAAAAQAEANKPKKVSGDFTDDDPVLGDKDAPVTIVEFSDFECPYCGRFFADAFPKIKEQYIDTGKAKLIFRDFPLSFHEKARPAALAANCVRDQKGDAGYFEYHDLIFKDQPGLSDDSLKEWAKGLGVDMAQFDTCVSSQKYADEVSKDLADGQKAGVSGTPAFIINGSLVSGAQPFEYFQPIIEEALSGK